ncbi:hypothetical protein LCGC14_2858770 [marine sediment metagenome]|uniref:Uncharacterized protein n=1 Tax=marine sediment metagenome TaxID=412755 RepID=A0A0F9AXA0_9ZZZZ
MDINNTISRARGECRHDSTYLKGVAHYCVLCHQFHKGATSYDSDPAAWTPELYQWIEGEGLVIAFIKQLEILVGITHLTGLINSMFFVLKATPLQKATALAKAIEERS